MARRWFGTDGIRDLAGEGRLAPDVVHRLGWAFARHLASRGVARPRVLLGRDPRPSGEALVAQLTAGLVQGGAQVEDAGLLPTPALAWSVAEGGYDLGFMLSASHNPPAYNGIKPFWGEGRKLTENEETAVETLMAAADRPPVGATTPAPTPADGWVARYIARTSEWLAEDGTLEDVRLMVDLAAGAATTTAVAVLKALGAEVTALHPAGERAINDACGTEHPDAWLALTRARAGAIGVAFDGDADRVLFADEQGVLLDGDDLLGILARDHVARTGGVPGGCVVSTVMSNLGLEELLGRHDVGLVRTAVGDRHVAEAMRTHGAVYGGEPSGHVVTARTDLASEAPVLIGDALIAAVRVLQAARRLGSPLAALRADRKRYPQLLVNVRMNERIPLDAWPAFEAERVRQDALLAETGRLVIRYSGTEPLLRIMGEGRDGSLVESAVGALAAVAQAAEAQQVRS